MAQKFQSRPVIVEAMQFLRDNTGNAIIDWAMPNCGMDLTGAKMNVKTKAGQILIAEDGDWVVKRAEGDFYPSSKEAFKLMFEEVK